MRCLVTIAAFLLVSLSAFAAGPATISNNDSCDIALQPAATLLLPYFDVDFKAPQSQATQTLFTIQNTSPLPQIARVTLWTDWGFPALYFSIFLTGYDVQGLNLYDILRNAVIAPAPPYAGGTSSNTQVPSNPTAGSQPAANDANPNHLSLSLCTYLPGKFSESLLAQLQQMFTTGVLTAAYYGYNCNTATHPHLGNTHATAIGYATVDVVATCTTADPTSADYWKDVLYDNVLSGDYQQVVPRPGRLTVQGGPLVHIRAVPEGGAAGAVVATTLPATFYERYTKTDRRQPLPSVFAPRFINGGAGAFNTTLKIWREGVVPGDAACSAYASNSSIPFAEAVRFDEHENATVWGPCAITCGPQPPLATSAAASVSAQNTAIFPSFAYLSNDVGGWLYLNLKTQSWVVTSMFADEINGTDAAAVALGNGCTPAPPSGARIGPAAGPRP